MPPTSRPPSSSPPASTDRGQAGVFTSSLDHLRAELERIDLLLRMQVLRARQVSGDDAFRGLTISDADIDALFSRPLGSPHWSTAFESPELAQLEALAAQRAEQLSQRCAETLRRGQPLRLPSLAERFGLTRFDVDVLLLCLAPELDTRYERLFAYLHDDVTRRRPGVGMVLGLLCPSFEDGLAARARFAPSAPLRRQGLLHLFSEPAQSHATLLSCTLKVDGRIVDWLLGHDEPDAHLSGHARVVTPRHGPGAPLPEALTARVARLVKDGVGSAPGGGFLYLHGPPGVGRQAVAEAVCAALGKRLMVLEGRGLEPLADGAEEVVRLALREAVLQDAVPYWRDFVPATPVSEPRPPRAELLKALKEHPGWVILSGEVPWEPSGALGGRPFSPLEFQLPDARDRARLWAAALGDALVPTEAEELIRMASRYRFTEGRIRDAAATARTLARTRDPARGRVAPAELAEACRLHSGRQLSGLARRITSQSSWEDLVLPEEQLERLRELCAHARYREQVFGDWGFERKLTTGKGLSFLFTGPPGTGKTMTAGIMARELGLELYQIDLSSMVSKYVGETEKHLARVFAEAEDTGAVLFFDEADALFGKRSEVRDSHDRYANLETSYLLQRIDAYEGMVILATNFSRNLDEAFVRRFQAIIEFSLPDERQRQQLWERIWPAEVPRAPNLDLAFMARRFELSGGLIRNIALAAAFLAAASRGPVTQAHLLHATRREYQKLGRRVDEALFQTRA